jgi:FkbM family methyltransferase
VEPSPEAAGILTMNLDANGCENVVRDYIGVGFSDENREAILQRGGPNNLGGTRVSELERIDDVRPAARRLLSSIRLVRGDEALAGLTPGLIKIDVEGHEFEALNGLAQTIRRCRPRLFVEVWNDHLERMEAWRSEFGYDVVWVDSHYKKVTNMMLVAR